MLLIIACGVLLAAGIVAIIAWGGERFVPPATPAALSRSSTETDDSMVTRQLAGLRLYVWWATVFTVIGTATGILITGAGGRLVMRALALTSPDAAGGLTEAQARVGDITGSGTIAYLVFGALPFAFASAAMYLLAAPWLPTGRLGGPAFGVVLFVTVSPFVDPLRADNIDFDLVGPGWLSILLFGVLAVLQGAALAALAGRLSRSLPVIDRRDQMAAASPLLAAVVLVPIGVILALGALVASTAPRALPWLLTTRASRTGVIVGRTLLVVAVLAALPAFIGSVISIAQP